MKIKITNTVQVAIDAGSIQNAVAQTLTLCKEHDCTAVLTFNGYAIPVDAFCTVQSRVDFYNNAIKS